jgi:D-sedoheptulose 7-phosphate isomerase
LARGAFDGLIPIHSFEITTGVQIQPLEYLQKLTSSFEGARVAATRILASQLEAARLTKSHVFICGNGGSAANANHWANDLLYGAAKGGRGGVRAHSLSANTSVLMCLANDTGYDNIFSGQLDVLASPGDILIALSGSGNSPNILRAIELGNRIGRETWAIVGFEGGKALAKHAIHFPISDMQIAEDPDGRLPSGHP